MSDNLLPAFVGAPELGKDFIGCDSDMYSVEIARKRLAAPRTLPLFAANA